MDKGGTKAERGYRGPTRGWLVYPFILLQTFHGILLQHIWQRSTDPFVVLWNTVHTKSNVQLI